MPTDLPPNFNPAPQPQPTPAAPTPQGALPGDGNAFRIATIAGIPIRLHWTFVALLVLLAFPGLARGGGASVAWPMIAFVLLLFGCVALHELGHALVARQYGIRTREIVLTPIGGLTRFVTLPQPRQELWISLAGPCVNLALALALWALCRATGQPVGSPPFGGQHIGLAANLMWANAWLFGFNILPAFPMDGGRVLRALLARGMSDLQATTLAARIGQGFAIALGLAALLAPNFLMLIVAGFIFLGAGQEAAAFATRSLTQGHRVQEAMVREYRTLTPGTTLREASDVLLAGSQHDFPVLHGAEVVGMLARTDLLRSLAQQGADAYVAGAMQREPVCVRPDAELDTVLPIIQQAGPMLVMEDTGTAPGRLVGILTQEHLYEFLVLTQLRSRT
jgi:Zn-dependent protease/CBS domain-containing protein